MSRFMDYGPDWPPAPVPVEAEHEPMTLAQRCGAWTIAVALLWALGAIWLHFHPPIGRTLLWTDTPAHGHTTDVTATLPPHPAMTPGHPGQR